MSEKSLEQLYQNLEKYSHFDDDPEYCEKFLDTVDQIILKKNPSSIPIILKYFDDNSDYNWVFENTMLALESYPEEVHTKEVIKNIKYMIITSPIWLHDIINRILNHPDCFDIFRKNLHLAPKIALLKLFDTMEVMSPHRHPLIAELRQKIVEKKK